MGAFGIVRPRAGPIVEGSAGDIDFAYNGTNILYLDNEES
jgi:hypothetical protein